MARMPRRILPPSIKTGNPCGLIHPAQHLHDAQRSAQRQQPLVLAGAEVAVENHLDTCRQGLPRNRKEHYEACVAQEPRVRGIAGAKHFEELFFDDILAQEERAVAPC